uniref:Uncharacterized protein n=1 Tax=Lactuca sativa TaxID=4236 RepID=A0A9R1W1S8_LACSA|nr:hypothetical protein LSAT_V11C400199100 [Lactuca sativa]
MVHKPFKVWDLSAYSMPFQIGPLKCWRGGLCISRSIGDRDLSSAGGRLVISSVGVWDALSTESALECSRGLAPESTAAQIVKVREQKNCQICNKILCNGFYFLYMIFCMTLNFMKCIILFVYDILFSIMRH